uniref:Ribosomal RNA small subunit methyltransferase NEP1 n=1 Tax=Chromera velia CCMP2878 TaxID=1169474 RepID=A0A0G4FJ15_9ALVE|eukprot:Cvel_17300.t1-p1 / transcript=Cvel_17300.t1 / gene=Cvel_17300 / organism=Chromera_velia_CCMP2878 / gene_product=Ribosomal RNA small subunit methyltransferase NEP1, putative / transcript_product=Ribosomal RNA small subunit methyltransferase NEP1, putative / location=Cvel_scaffold1373:26737-27507(+) / protein_length=257 / sequence_SO=supercontig / SO=protein_coding / is_pseudo=false
MSAELPAPLTAEQKTSGQRVIVILEDAPLEVVKVKHGFQLANCDDHRGLLQNAKRDPAEMRPDITHQCLMTLLDSPLNKAGRLVIYIHTAKNVVIEVSPQLRVPRTYKRFAGLFVELLQRHKIRAKDGSEILMKVVSGPVSKYLPVNGRKIGFSVNGKLVLLREHVKSLPECQPPKRPLLLEEGDAADDAAEPQKKKKKANEAEGPVSYVVGAVSHSDPAPKCDYVEECVSISNYPLSASVCCSKICNEFENLWGVH